MKSLLLFTLCISLATGALAQSRQVFVNLDNAIAAPAETQHLSLDPSHPQLPEFLSRLPEFTALQAIRCQAANDAEGLETLVAQLRELPSLQDLTLFLDDPLALPASLAELNHLQALQVVQVGTAEALTRQVHALPFTTPNGKQRIVDATFFAADTIDRQNIAQVLGLTIAPPASDTATQRIEPYCKSYRHVQPPMPEMQTERTTVQVPSDQPSLLEMPGGTRIEIPENAFVDQAGKPVEGPVQIDYREFQDQLDIWASGIPMTYDSGGTRYTFESAGMFELLASQNGEELALGSGKQIEVDLVSSDSAAKYGFYSFNDATGNWEYQGSGNENITVETMPLDSASPFQWRSVAYGRYQRLFRRSGWASRSFDSLYLADRFENLDYYHLDPVADQGQLPVNRKVRHCDVKDHGLVHIKRYRPRKRLFARKKRKKRQLNFVLDYSRKDFPELAAFSGLIWKDESGLKYRDFRKQFVRKKLYSDIRIERGPGSDAFTMVLKELHGGYIRLTATPQRKNDIYIEEPKPDEEPPLVAALDYDRLEERYTRSFGRRERRFNRKHDRRFDRYKQRQARKAKKEERLWQQVEAVMTDRERALSREDWLASVRAGQIVDIFDSTTRQRRRVSRRPRRSVSVSMLGLMNVDYSMPMRQFTRVLASYSDKDSSGTVAMNDICVLENQVNSARFYTPGSLYLDLRKSNVLLGVSQQDELWLFDASDFAESSLKSQTGGKLRYHFPMRNLGKPGSLEEVRQALTFQ